MNSFIRGSARSGVLSATILAVTMLLGFGAKQARAATIDIDLNTLSAVGLVSTSIVPSVVDDDNGVKKLYNLNPVSWAEFPFTVTEGGVYTFSGKAGTANPPDGDQGLPVTIAVDIRKSDSQQHFSSADITIPRTGSDEAAYQPSADFSAPGFPLAPGDYVLRVRNVSMVHTQASNRAPGYLWRSEISVNANRRVDLGSLKLTSTAALPATGTISGRISASDLGYGVGFAHVMAIPAGQDVAEPSPFWQTGHWTVADANGNYTLTVPADTPFTVAAGRPDTYEVAGTRVADVTVGAGATVTRDLALKSRWTSVDGEGQLTGELEYFHNKVPDAFDTNWTNILLYSDGNASNGFKMSWAGGGDYVDIYVDVPTGHAGAYDLSIVYSSFPGGTMQFIANPGEAGESIIETPLPNSSDDENDPSKGYWFSKTVKYPDAIQLKAGRNVIRALVVDGDVAFDAIKLEKHISDVPVPGVANPRDANFAWVIGEKEPGGTVAYPEKAGNSITNTYRGGYVEIPMLFDAPGIYQAVIPTKAWAPAPSIQLDLRMVDTDDHYATADIAVPAVSTDYSSNTIANIPVLQAGNYILRVRNTTQFRSTPSTRADFNAYGDNGFIPNRLDFGQIVFTKTGNLPAVGTLSGTVKSSSIGNVGVGQAIVMANDTGATVAEPSIHWQKGFWTFTDDTGAYTMPVLAKAYDVQAGQASMYSYGGGLAQATVASGGTATANINLPSRVTQDAQGHYEINVEADYFTAKPRDSFGTGYAAAVIAFQYNAKASNQLALGYTDGGDYIDIPVDVPAGAAGEYTLTDYYFNGYWIPDQYPDGVVSFTANLGQPEESRIEDSQPSTALPGEPAGTGYNNPGVKVFGAPITLKEGHNIIRMRLESGSSNFDAFKLTSLATFPLRPSAARALKIAGGFETAPTPASGTAFQDLDANDDNTITMADVVSLAKQGYL